MTRLLLICVISLLFVSGWGHVLASAFCPNMRDMSGCGMQAGKASASSPEGIEMGDMQTAASATESKADRLEQPLASCCASRSQVPPVPVFASRGAEQSKQDLGAALRNAPKVIMPPAPSFAPPVRSRQHAPPIDSTQRHILISVFLI